MFIHHCSVEQVYWLVFFVLNVETAPEFSPKAEDNLHLQSKAITPDANHALIGQLQPRPFAYNLTRKVTLQITSTSPCSDLNEVGSREDRETWQGKLTVIFFPCLSQPGSDVLGVALSWSPLGWAEFPSWWKLIKVYRARRTKYGVLQHIKQGQHLVPSINFSMAVVVHQVSWCRCTAP